MAGVKVKHTPTAEHYALKASSETHNMRASHNIVGG